jgi:cell division protein FtsB
MSVVWQQKTHGVLRRQGNTSRTFARFFLSVMLVIAALAAAYLALVASNVHLARQVWAMEHEFITLQRETHALKAEIGRLSCIPVLQQRSVELNYQPATSVNYVYVEGP